MSRHLAAITALAVLLFALPAASLEKIYFGDTGDDRIRRCSLDGSNIEVLVSTDLNAVGSIAVDRTGGKMYWCDWPAAGSNVKRANLDGSNVEELVSGLQGPYGIALDVAAGKMYWTEFSAGKIRRADLDGTNIEDLVTTGLSHVGGIALDVAGGKMYWTDQHIPGRVRRANLDGTNIEALVDYGEGPMEIALDLAGGKMYWADLGTDSLYRADLDGSNLEGIIASEFGTPVGVALDLAAGKIYYSDSGAGGAKIKRANLDGTGVEDVISSGIGSCYGLTLGPAEAECSDASLDGPWIVIVSGVEPYTYPVYFTFDGQGTIDDIGSFNIPDSAGTYSFAPDCSLSGYFWSDGYAPFTGYLDSDTTATIDMGLGAFPMLKVRDVGALEGCWAGSFVQDSTLVGYDVIIHIDEFGEVVSTNGFPASVSGRMFFESSYLAGHLILDAFEGPWQEINIRDATVVADSLMTGTFALDCSDCKGGTLHLIRCSVTGVGDRPAATALELHPNCPNPFNPQTTIAYTLPQAGRVSLRVYDVAGRLVRTLVDDVEEAGGHVTTWGGRDGRGVAVVSGVYFVRLESESGVRTRKMVLLK